MCCCCSRGIAQALLVEGDRVEPAGLHQPPTWMGAISVLTGGGLGVRMRAETDCGSRVIQPDDFRRLAFAHPSVHQRVMSQVAPVMSRITAIEQNRERLAALGTLAAGLAHELNNPAAAAQRAAAQMTEALEVVDGTISRFVESGVERSEAAELVALHDEAVARAATRGEAQRPRRRRRRGRSPRPPRGPRSRRAVAHRRAARRRGRRPGVARPRRRARRRRRPAPRCAGSRRR